MKRKSPVSLSLMEDSAIPDECASAFYPPMATITKRQKMQTHFKSLAVQVSPEISPVSRACTPSPPLSPVSRKVTKSIVRQSKRKRLVRYRFCTELVDPERDLSIGSNYEMFLFSHMVSEKGRNPCFRCRLCPQSKQSTFSAKSIGEFEETIPSVERHLLTECKASPAWLQRAIVEAKATHEVSTRKPYSHLVWKRVLAHAIYSRIKYTKRVKFAEKLCHERIIPARTRA